MMDDRWHDELAAPSMPVGRAKANLEAFSAFAQGMFDGPLSHLDRARLVAWTMKRLGKSCPDAEAAVSRLLDMGMEAVVDESWARRVGGWIASRLAVPKELAFSSVWDGRGAVWTAMFVHDVRRLPSPRSRYLATYSTLCGPAAGLRIELSQSAGMLTGMLRTIGWTSPEWREPSPMELGGMHFAARLRGLEGGISLGEVHAQPSHRALNSDLMRAREGRCVGPARLPRCGPCRFGRDECPLATHAQTWPMAMCRNTSVVHDGPIVAGGWCAECLESGCVNEKEHVL